MAKATKPIRPTDIQIDEAILEYLIAYFEKSYTLVWIHSCIQSRNNYSVTDKRMDERIDMLVRRGQVRMNADKTYRISESLGDSYFEGK